MLLRYSRSESYCKLVGKPGLDNIGPEVMKADTEVTANIMINLLQDAWEKELTGKRQRQSFPRKGISATERIGEESGFYPFQAKSSLG